MLATLEGFGEKLINKARHGYTASFTLVIEDRDKLASDLWRIMAESWHNRDF